jgi:DNA-binding transcriptional MocR family regulator
VIANQLGRRNLTPKQKSYLRGLQYNREKSGHGGDRYSDGSSPDNQDLKTAERLAEEHGVSRDTIEQDGKLADAAQTLEAKVREDIRTAILGQRKNGQPRTTKTRIKKAAKAVTEGPSRPSPS